MSEEYYNIGPLVSNMDFYDGGAQGSTAVFIYHNVFANSMKEAYAVSSIDTVISTNFETQKIAYASVQIDTISSSTSVAMEIVKTLSDIAISTNITASANKTSYATQNSNIVSSFTPSASRTVDCSSIIQISTSASVEADRTRNVQSSVSIQTTASVEPKFIIVANTSILINSNIILKPPIRFSPSYIDQSSIRTLLILDGKPLTNHGRKLDTSLSFVNVEVANWNNSRNRYYKKSASSGRKTFNLRWDMVPNSILDTVDNRHGRDFLHSVAEDPDVHELKIINQNESNLTPYTEATYSVFIRSYSETLIRRYISEGVYLYECNLVLEEV